MKRIDLFGDSQSRDASLLNLRKYIWKMKVLLKIKIFMWFLHQKVILTKDNLAKRNWTGCKKMHVL
jgi:hypothetical protein